MSYSVRETGSAVKWQKSESIDPIVACTTARQLSLDLPQTSFVVLNQVDDPVATFMRGHLIPTGL